MQRRCIHCRAWLETVYGEVGLWEHTDTAGTEADPHAPGDYDNVCAPCNYGKGLPGGPSAEVEVGGWPSVSPDDYDGDEGPIGVAAFVSGRYV